MKSIDVYIYIVISIFGVAYPILLQVVARLDEKYSSDKIVELFNQESIKKQFTIGLMFSLAFLFIWSLNLPVLIENPYWLFFLLRRSAYLLVIISTIFLIIIFFLFVEKVITYYTPSKFIQYLINKSKKYKSEIFFEALTEVTLSFIRKKERNYMKTLNQYFYEKFRDIRRDAGKDPVIYPESHYDFINKIGEELALSQEKRNYLLEDRAVGGSWLLGPHESKKISEKTYSELWRNLSLVVQYDHDNLIHIFWKNSYNYFVSDLEAILPEYDFSSASREPLNKEIVSERGEERRRFLEFHNILGALLLYKKKYDCLKYIFNYTQNYPPSYVLFPTSIDEIFQFYIDIGDQFNERYRWVSNRYPFPELDNIYGEMRMRYEIQSYMALLFLRQYSLSSYLITDSQFQEVQIPNSSTELKTWVGEIVFFREAIKEHLQDEELLDTLGLHFLTQERHAENNKASPLEYIDGLKSFSEKTADQKEFIVKISKEKVDQFEEKTKAILEKTIKEILKVNNESKGENIKSSDKWYVNGLWSLIDKINLSDNNDIFHANFDSFLAKEISINIKTGLGDVFLYKRSKGYVIKQEVFWKAIDRLKLDESHIIINFGIDIEKYLSENIPDLSTEKYKGIEIINLERIPRVRDSFFVLKKSDLPYISTLIPEKERIAEYNLKKKSDQFEIYTSVIDMNKQKELIEKYSSDKKSPDQVRKSALLLIELSLEFKWCKNIEVIQIQEYSDFFQRGIPNDIKDIKTFGQQ